MVNSATTRLQQSTDLKSKTGIVAPKVLAEIIRRIVKVAAPEKIILFGSAARGEMGPNSDVDLLVIKAGAHRRQLTHAEPPPVPTPLIAPTQPPSSPLAIQTEENS